MPPTFLPNAYIDRFNRAMEYLGPLFDVAVRVWVARAFFLSGLSKIQNWDTTLTLFQFEYSVPLLPPNVAGPGRGVIQNQDYSLNVPDNPAAPGTVIIVYAAGLGAVVRRSAY